MDLMERLDFPEATVDTIADIFGLRNNISLAELRAAVGVSMLPGRDLIRIRRALDPVVRHCVSCCVDTYIM